MLSRRTFLTGLGATAIAVGCTKDSKPSGTGSSSAIETTTTTVRRFAGDLPDPSRAEGTDTLAEIEHIVVVMMENHSYDNYLGMLPRADGFTRDSNGKPTNNDLLKLFDDVVVTAGN